MSVYAHSATAHASPERVWAIWSDPSTWKRWDPGLVDIVLDGPFAPGTSGLMTTRTRGARGVRIVAVRPRRSFSLEAAGLLGTLLLFKCEVRPRADGGSTLSESVSVQGPLARLWAPLLGPRIAKTLIPALSGLARYAEDAGH